MRAFCSGVPSAINGRTAVEHAHEVHADVGSAGACDLFVVDELFGECGVAASVLLGQLIPSIARFVELLLPARVVGAALGPCIAGRDSVVGTERSSQPRSWLRNFSSDSEYRRSNGRSGCRDVR